MRFSAVLLWFFILTIYVYAIVSVESKGANRQSEEIEDDLRIGKSGKYKNKKSNKYSSSELNSDESLHSKHSFNGKSKSRRDQMYGQSSNGKKVDIKSYNEKKSRTNFKAKQEVYETDPKRYQKQSRKSISRVDESIVAAKMNPSEDLGRSFEEIKKKVIRTSKRQSKLFDDSDDYEKEFSPEKKGKTRVKSIEKSEENDMKLSEDVIRTSKRRSKLFDDSEDYVKEFSPEKKGETEVKGIEKSEENDIKPSTINKRRKKIEEIVQQKDEETPASEIEEDESKSETETRLKFCMKEDPYKGNCHDGEEEESNIEEEISATRKIKYSTKFAHEKKSKKNNREVENILKLHKKAEANSLKKMRRMQEENDESSEEVDSNRRISFVQDEDEM